MTLTYSNSNIYELYDRDFYLWIQETARLVREGKFSELDIENLVDEVESLGRWEKREVDESFLAVIRYLLKYKYCEQQQREVWRVAIGEHRTRIKEILADSPSLRALLLEYFTQIYQDAKELVELEMELAPDSLPSESPFTIEEFLDEDFLPL